MQKMVRAALVAAALVAGIVIGHNVNIYSGLNAGVTWGHCGIEVKGDPGLFCDPVTEDDRGWDCHSVAAFYGAQTCTLGA